MKKIFFLQLLFGISYILSAQNYYESVNASSSEHLRSSLHNLIDDHTEVSYNACKDFLQLSDVDPNNSDQIILVYKRNSVPGLWDSGSTWNREHVWAKSLGGFTSGAAYTDLHHLKPADPSVNSSKGNKSFDAGGDQHPEATECYSTTYTWEPPDDVKGDIARILFYMDVRYEGGDNEPDLTIVEEVNTYPNPEIGRLTTLLQWHIQDPVDAFELNRNEVIYGIQGNRNPFIDHPEYVSVLWGGSPPLTYALHLKGIMSILTNGSNGKALHFYAEQDISDLSIYGIGVANNGGGTDGLEEYLPSISVSAGDDILLARSPEFMASYLGDCYSNFEHILIAGNAISQNGDDAIELYEQGQLIETFGDVDVDGTNQDWEYTNSWAYNLGETWSYGLECESFYGSISGTGSFTFDLSSLSINESMNVFYHIPDDVQADSPILIVLHGGGRNASEYRDAFILKANSLGFIVIAPEFSQSIFPGGDAYNLGNIFVDGDHPTSESLNAESDWSFSIIDPLFTYVKGLTNNTSQTYDVFGNSAGAQVAHRLLLFRPNSPINKIVACAAGWYTFPDMQIDFPYGIGASPALNLQFEDLFNKNLRIMIGSLDNDPNAASLRHTEEAELQGAHRLERAASFYQYSQELSHSLGLSSSWSFEVVDGVGHDYVSMASLASDWLYSNSYSNCFYPMCSETEGCTDENAFNYDSLAAGDDGSCIAVSYGCIDANALNYDSLANTDDGSCVAVVYGCIDVNAFNYDSLANSDDGSCVAVMYGCIDVNAFNYDSLANTDDGSCVAIVYGCIDTNAFNHNPQANIDDASCQYDQTYALSLQGILDLYGSVPSGDPNNIGYSGTDGKAIHLVAHADIADLSIFGLGIANNGGGTDGVEFTFPSMSVSAGDNILVYRVGTGANSANFMSNYFDDCYSRFEHNIATTGWMSQNGDDPAELFENGQLIEAFGDVNGSDMPDDPYEDSWAYKLDDGTWDFAGQDCDQNDGTYTVDGSGCPYPLCTAISISQQEVIIGQGWNIVSTYMLPENSSIDVLFSSLSDELIIIKDYLGNAYLPEWDFNGIGSAQIGRGYLIKVNQTVIFTFYGTYLSPELNPISLPPGWSIVGYLRTESTPLDQIFETLVEQDLIIIVKDYQGYAYLPEYNFNGVGNMNPGQGYLIKTTGDCTLQF